MTRIAMIGLGSMNGAILAGFLDSGVDPDLVTGTARSAGSAQERAQQYGITVLAEEDDPQANERAAADADVIMLGVKPPQIVSVCQQLRDVITPDAVVVSVAAAVTVEMMESALRPGQPVIRTMPNTPLSVGAGVVGMTPGHAVTEQQTSMVSELLSGAGAVHVIEEAQINALTAVAGSGPAYAFYLAEHMAAAGVELGLDEELAADLAAQTVYGAGLMLVRQRGAQDAAELRRRVTSPNGTTHQAIETFNAHGMDDAIRTGAKASAARAAEITDQLRG